MSASAAEGDLAGGLEVLNALMTAEEPDPGQCVRLLGDFDSVAITCGSAPLGSRHWLRVSRDIDPDGRLTHQVQGGPGAAANGGSTVLQADGGEIDMPHWNWLPAMSTSLQAHFAYRNSDPVMRVDSIEVVKSHFGPANRAGMFSAKPPPLVVGREERSAIIRQLWRNQRVESVVLSERVVRAEKGWGRVAWHKNHGIPTPRLTKAAVAQ